MIPVIDFQSTTVLEEIRKAYTTVGFAVFTNTLNKQDQRNKKRNNQVEEDQQAKGNLPNINQTINC